MRSRIVAIIQKPMASKSRLKFYLGMTILSSTFLLTSCFSSLLPTSQAPSASSAVAQASIELTPGGHLIRDEETGTFEVRLIEGDSYTFQAKVDGGDSSYSIAYVGSSKVYTLQDNVVTASAVEEGYGSMSSQMKVRLIRSGRTVSEIEVKIHVYKTGHLPISLPVGNGVTRNESGAGYKITLRRGSSLILKPNVLGYEDAEFTFSQYREDNTEFTIDKDGKLTMSEKANLSLTTYLVIKSGKGEREYGTLQIPVSVAPASDEVSLTLEENDPQVKLSKPSSAFHGEYQLTVPYSGNYYPLPDIKVAGYEGEGDFEFVSVDEVWNEGDPEWITFRKIKDKYYFRVREGSRGIFDFEIHFKNKEGVVLAELPCSIAQTNVGKGVFGVQVGDDYLTYTDGETVVLQRFLPTDLIVTLNGKRRIIDLKVGDRNVLPIDTLGSVDPRSLGQTTISASYDEEDSEGTSHHYEFSITVKVIDESKLLELIVDGGASSLSIVDDHLYISKGVYVSTDIGIDVPVSGSSSLTSRIHEGSGDTRTVTLSYSDRDQTVSKTIEGVQVLSSGSFPKQTITKTYSSFDKYSAVTPSTGNVKCLVIPIWFTDSSSFIDVRKSDAAGKNQKQQIREDLETAIFGDGTGTVYESVASFYKKESRNAFNLQGEIAPWYNASIAATEITSETEMAIEAVNAYFATSGKTLSDFDSNEDGVIDSLMLYYGSNYFGPDHHSRAFQRGQNVVNKENYPFARYTWFSAMNMYNINGREPETTGQLETNDLSSLVDEKLASTTAIHEFGHTFGLDDYYEETQEGEERREPACGFSMQDSSIGGHDPYSTMTIGWTSPYVFSASSFEIGETVNVTLHDFQSSNEVVVLSPSWSSETQGFSEYLALELYTPTGLNEYHANRYSSYHANAIGLRVWHVNGYKTEELRHVYTNNDGPETYDQLHLIRRDKSSTFMETSHKLDEALFVEGDSFAMNDYKLQFKDATGLLDNGDSLGWAFTITNIATDGEGVSIARLTLTRVV